MSEAVGVQPGQKKLSRYMITSITILAIVGFISILLILFGDFEDKGGRVFCTFIAFAVFTIFTALDTSTKHPAKSIPLAAVVNIIILSLALAATWLGLLDSNDSGYNEYGERSYDYNDYYSAFANFAQVIGIAIIGRLGYMVVDKTLEYTATRRNIVNTVAKVSAVSFGLSTLLFIIPIGLTWFEYGDAYWKVTIAIVLLAGLSVSILCLLLWFYREEGENPFKNPSQAKAKTVSPNQVQPQPVQETVVETFEPEARTEVLSSAEARREPSVQFDVPRPGFVSWPVFPNGLPLPATKDGRPDFNALQVVVSMHLTAENQFFQK